MKSIRVRLYGSMALLIIFFLVQALAVSWFTNSQRESMSRQVRQNTQASSQLTELATLAQQIRRYEKEYFVYVQNKEKRDGYAKEFGAAAGRIGKLLDTLSADRSGTFTAQEYTEITRWRGAHAFYVAEMEQIFSNVTATQATADAAAAATSAATPGKLAAAETPPARLPTPAEANDMIKAGKDRFGAELVKGVDAMAKTKTAATLGLAQSTADNYHRLLQAVLVTVALGIGLALFLVVTLPPTITRPIAALSEVAEAIARGNLDKPFAEEGAREFEPLVRSLEKMRASLGLLSRKLRARTEQA